MEKIGKDAVVSAARVLQNRSGPRLEEGMATSEAVPSAAESFGIEYAEVKAYAVDAAEALIEQHLKEIREVYSQNPGYADSVIAAESVAWFMVGVIAERQRHHD